MRAAAERSTEPRQLDLFLDGRDAFLVHEVVTSLVVRDRVGAETGLERLRDEHPVHPDLPALALLVAAMNSRPPSPATHVTVTAGIEAVQQGLAPAARRLLGEDAATFLQPFWQALAATAASLPFDEAHPYAHRSWLCQQHGDWPAVRAAVEAEPDWATRPRLRYRLGLARHHLGEPEAAIRLWLPLCWMDPALFARRAPTLPSAILREGWEAFERAVSFDEWLADTTDATVWFPAWLLLRHRGLVHLFRADEVPDAGAAAGAFRHLLSLVPLESQGLSDALVRERRALQQLSPGFFRYYLDVVGQRRPRA
ncbi:MAG: hypothetical protein HY561_05175 [Gemmatimonadetes bacterium]|nr:hypothetical protein [Gemmatimonadota bacterium]